MLGGFLAALPCGRKIEVRLQRACAGDARRRVHSIEKHAFLGRDSDNDIGAADSWLQSQGLMQARKLGRLTEEVVGGNAPVGRQPLSGGEGRQQNPRPIPLIMEQLQEGILQSFSVQGGVVALLLATQTCIGLAPCIKQGIRIFECQAYVGLLWLLWLG